MTEADKTMKTKPTVIVIGAGPAGLAAAQQLAEAGHRVSLFEADNTVGGLARSFSLWGQRVDCGPHRFFSSDSMVNDYFTRMVGQDYTLVNRLTRIYYGNKFFLYPLQAANALGNLPLRTVVEILLSYAGQRLAPLKEPRTFEEWVVNRFGRKLFEIFFKNYSEKLWGIPCAKIDADWAAQRIKRLSLWEAVKGALGGKAGQRHKTLLEQFAYPKGGSGMLYERIAQEFCQAGGQLHLQSPVRGIVQDEKGKVRGVELANGTRQLADVLVSTMPLTTMVKGLQGCPSEVRAACERLTYRNTILVYVEVEARDLFPDNWIYVHSPDVRHGRITNFRNWCPSLTGDKASTILCVEYWCFDHDEIWQRDEAWMGRLAIDELRKIKVLRPEHRTANTFMLHLPRCYPVYETGYQRDVLRIKGYLDGIPNLLAIGRYGAFKYNNQDHSLLMGLLAARQISGGQDQQLWEINTDSEYQEHSEVRYGKEGG